MALTDNDRVQEFVLVAGDKISLVNKRWWYALVLAVVAAWPLYFVAKASFVSVALSSMESPQIIYKSQEHQPLAVLDKKIFSLGNNSYSGYVKIRNIEFDWGVPDQKYNAEFKTFGGTTLTTIKGTTFILPASEKLIVFSRFTSQQKPDQLVFTLEDSHFIKRPSVDFTFDLERETTRNMAQGLIVSGGVKNTTPFIVKEINLPVLVYDNRNEIIGVNFTYINDVLASETRTFQYTWPGQVPGAVRSEIKPEVNIFNREIFQVAPGVSPFDDR